jgi:tRNA (mo5U34)-methyltransferase
LTPVPDDTSAATTQARLDELLWYHTIDVGGGVTTRGWFDLRHAIDQIPWPEVAGKRCLDIGTWDGFYAFEMERRGAGEVVAIDVADLAEIDYPPAVRADRSFDPSQRGKQPRATGFHLLKEVLGSRVQWRAGNIYDLDPGELGTFDIVVGGSLLVHLRDPVRALDAVRRVTSGAFLSIDYVHPVVDLLARRRALFELRGERADFQWWMASDRGLRQLLHVGGFTVERASKRFLLRPGAGDKPAPRSLRGIGTQLLNRFWTGDWSRGGHMHRAYLARPRF